MMRKFAPRASLLLLLLFAALPTFAADDGARYGRIFQTFSGNVVPVTYELRLAEAPEGGQGAKLEGVLCGLVLGRDGRVLVTADVFPEMDGDPRQTFVPSTFSIRFPDMKSVRARAVGVDRKLNIALLQIENPEGIDVADLSFSTKAMEVGARVLLFGLLGEPHRFAPMLHEARISAVVNSPRRMYALDTLVQDLTIGGLVVSDRGEPIGFIGEDTLTTIPSGPSEMAQSGNVLSLFASMSQGQRPGYPMLFPHAGVLDAFLASPPAPEDQPWARRGWLGIVMQPLSEELSSYWSVPGPGGVVIGAVLDGSPAQRAGLQVGDIILEVDHAPVEVRETRDLGRFRELVQSVGAGREIPLRVFRDGRRQIIPLTLGNRPKTMFLAEENEDEDFGLTVKELTFDFLQAINLPSGTQGVFVSEIENAGWADLGGLSINDVITEINGEPISSIADYGAALQAARDDRRDEVVFFVKRGTRRLFVPVKTDW